MLPQRIDEVGRRRGNFRNEPVKMMCNSTLVRFLKRSPFSKRNDSHLAVCSCPKQIIAKHIHINHLRHLNSAFLISYLVRNTKRKHDCTENRSECCVLCAVGSCIYGMCSKVVRWLVLLQPLGCFQKWNS